MFLNKNTILIEQQTTVIQQFLFVFFAKTSTIGFHNTINKSRISLSINFFTISGLPEDKKASFYGSLLDVGQDVLIFLFLHRFTENKIRSVLLLC